MDLNSFLLILSILCLGISLYAFYKYALTQSDPLFILGLSMGTIAIAIFCGYLNEVHVGNVILHVAWIWYAGTSSGLLFLFLSSLMASRQHFQMLKRWHVIASIGFLVLLFLTPVLPPFPSPLVPALLNLARPLICLLIFFRYARLYLSKATHFSLVMCLAFLFLSIGFGMITPQLLQPDLVLVTVVGAILRICGYSTLLLTYVATK